MRHHVVNHRGVEVNEAPVQANSAVGPGAAPAGAGIAQAQLAPLHLELRGEVVQPLGKPRLGLAHEPGNHHVANLLWRGAVRQRHLQAVVLQLGTGGAKVVTGV